jgi:hypothetical protein
VSAPLQAFVFSSYLLNVLLQLANKNGIQNNNKKIVLGDILLDQHCAVVLKTPSVSYPYSRTSHSRCIPWVTEDFRVHFFVHGTPFWNHAVA